MSSTRSWPEVASGSVAAAPAWGTSAAAATTPATAARRDLDMVREPLTYGPRIASAIRRSRPRLGRAQPPGPLLEPEHVQRAVAVERQAGACHQSIPEGRDPRSPHLHRDAARTSNAVAPHERDDHVVLFDDRLDLHC